MTRASHEVQTSTPPAGLTLIYKVHFRNGSKGRKRLRVGSRPKPAQVEAVRIPRVTKLMALALHLDNLIRQGIVKDYADLARLGGVSRARISQVMGLLNLAPVLQEAILFMPRGLAGRDPMTERHVRRVVAEVDWDRQREVWKRVGPPLSAPDSRDSMAHARTEARKRTDGRPARWADEQRQKT